MTDAAVISGSLVDAKNVNTHKVMRLIIDVPAENALKVIAAFGWPTMVNPVSVAVARLNDLPQRVVDKPPAETSPRPVTVMSEPVGDDSLGYCVALEFQDDPDPPQWFELNCDQRPAPLDVEVTHWMQLPSAPQPLVPRERQKAEG